VVEAVSTIQVCGSALAQGSPQPLVVVYRWVCPFCDGDGRWGDDGPCYHCAGIGLTNDRGGHSDAELTPAPRPPGVMARPCIECAYRPGSPEEGSPLLPTGDAGVFYCHQGLQRTARGYSPAGWIGESPSLPLGAAVCAGWWAAATGQPAPSRAYRELPERAVSRTLTFADLVLDTELREMTRSGRTIHLSRTEAELLALFLRNPGRVISTADMDREVWGHMQGPRSNSPQVYVGYLRRKLEARGGSRLIWTVRSAGYVLRDAPAGAS